MPDSDYYKPAIIADVGHAVDAMNGIVVCLQRDDAIPSDIMQISYPRETVDEFLRHRQAVVDSLSSASTLASLWFEETGENLAQNVEEASRIDDSMREIASDFGVLEEYTKATEGEISVLEADIHTGEGNLASAQRTLASARDRLRRRNRTRRTMRIAAIATLFIAPVVSVGLAAVDLLALQRGVDQQEETIRTVQEQLATSTDDLQLQRVMLASEHSEIERLIFSIAELIWREDYLADEAARLDAERTHLADLAVRINECLHVVHTALSSSAGIAVMCSMRNVVAGIRGVVSALGADAMFAGPLALLNDTAVARLDQRVTAIRRHRLEV